MKKKLLALALLSSLSTTAMADTILGVYFGGDVWRSSMDGNLNYNNSTNSTNFDESDNYRLYARFEHPVPLVPNAAIRLTNIDIEGKSGSDSVELKSIDYTLYYEFLDNDLVSLDAGITLRQIDGDYKENSGTVHSFDAPLPMGYVAAEVGLPFTPLTAFANVTAIGLAGDSYSDAEIGLAFMINPGYVLDWSLKLGYRIQKLDLDDIDNVNADLTIDGAFLGLEGHF